ncbi:hypothetical protein RJT34_17229 [Clitoria ternatea]|uniref:Uncharacterized protein n=1 Tax=Clitoria ternatea TaxID=43366 RepID=A0AAN9J8K7_CLITE
MQSFPKTSTSSTVNITVMAIIPPSNHLLNASSSTQLRPGSGFFSSLFCPTRVSSSIITPELLGVVREFPF